jgi:UDP-N-acetylmuramyl tripeptide synthase
MTKSLHTIAHSLYQPSRKIPNVTVTGVKLNSSQVEDGDLFIAIPGTNVDGHDFISDAIDSGAIAIISNGRDVGKLSVPQIKVANPRRAASIVAAEYYEHPTKGDRQYFTMGAGVKYNVFALDFSYLIDASSSINGSNPLANTLRFTLIFDFGALEAKS